MSYIITKTDGTTLVTIVDGSTTTANTPMTLIGRGVTSFGQDINTNFIRLLENNAKSTQPTGDPLVGQLWYDKTANALKVYNGTGYKYIGVTPSNSAPGNNAIGDIWYDTTAKQAKVYNGTGFDLVGPAYTTAQGISGVTVANVTDTLASSHVVGQIFASGRLVGLISSDTAYTPNVTIPGFSTIAPGITLSANISNNRFRGELVGNVTGNVSGNSGTATRFLNAVNINGVAFDGTIDITIADSTKLPLAGGTLTGALTLNGAPTLALHAATKGYVDTAISDLINGAPSTLDTINEIANALGNDPNLSVTLTNQISTKANIASPALTGVPTAPTAGMGTNTNQIATTAFVTTAVANGIPSGVITMWSGSILAIPVGWRLCDGTAGTPDLRDRFVLGAGGVYSVGSTGGSANAVVVAHSHTASSSVSDPGHNHTVVANPGGSSGAFGGGTSSSATTLTTSTSSTGISVATTVDVTGVSGTNANMPPYYALCYIMKL